MDYLYNKKRLTNLDIREDQTLWQTKKKLNDFYYSKRGST